MFQRPLGIIERALLISDGYAPFNVVAVLQMESPPPPEKFAEVLREIQEEYISLRVRVGNHSGKPRFVEMDRPVVPFMTMGRQDENHWLSQAESELSHRLDIRAGPLFHCTYLFSPQRAELILTFLHAIVDAPSISGLLHEILSRCTGQPTTSVAQKELPPSVERRFPAAFRGPRLALITAGYMLRQVADEIDYRWGLRGLPEAAVQAGSVPQVMAGETDSETTEKLVRRARSRQITLNSLLNAALLLGVHRKLYGGQPRPVRTFSFPDLRPFVSPPIPPDSLAAYFSMLRYTLHLDEQSSLWETSSRLHTQIYASLKRGDKYAANVMSAGLMRMMTRLRSVRMGTTALSYTGVSGLKREYGETRVCAVHGFISNLEFGPQYTAQVGLFDGRLLWDIVYLDRDMDREMALTVFDEIQNILNSNI